MTSLSIQRLSILFAALFGVMFLLAQGGTVSLAASGDVTIVDEKMPILYVDKEEVQSVSKGKYDYIEITKSCNYDFEGVCISVYDGPGVTHNKVMTLRNGMVLKVIGREGENGQVWYKVHFDEWLRYPERVEGDWYVPAVAGRIVSDDGERLLFGKSAPTSKRIYVDLSEHMIYAYDGDKEFLVTKVSTGVRSTPTPVGVFTIYKKTPSRYMQGPIPGVNDNPFDLPGVPWNLYFTEDGAVIHGSYWHERYGTEQSSGCINLPPELAKILYDWADVGTPVEIAL